MARYTKRDLDGHYYIESANGKLESNVFGHTYGAAIDRFAELEYSDAAQKSEVEQLKRNLEQCENGYRQTMHLLQCKLKNAKSEVAREIFEEIEQNLSPMLGLENDKEYVAILTTIFAELKKKYEGGEFEGEQNS